MQSRRFAMLDRKYTDDTNQEVNQYLNNDFKIEELARLGQRVGTDYLVISEVRKYNVADKSVVDPLDGTKSFHKGDGFSINLCFCVDGKPVISFIFISQIS